MSAEVKLAELGITLPSASSPRGHYLSHRSSGSTLILSGVISFSSNGKEWTGQVAAAPDLDDGYSAARVCAINVPAAIRKITGSLDSVKQFLYVGGYVNAAPLPQPSI